MPTRGRKEMARQAVKCFQSQTYLDRELLILDDADDPSFPEYAPLGEAHLGNIRYVRMNQRLPIPEKRQKCCELSSGNVIAHFDSDDFSDPHRLQMQADYMEMSGKQVVGFHSMLFYDVEKKKAYKYHGLHNYAIGTSLFFKREFWQAHPWKDINAGKSSTGLASDTAFVKDAERVNELFVTDAGPLMVARGHSGDTGQKRFYKDPFREVPLEALPASFPR